MVYDVNAGIQCVIRRQRDEFRRPGCSRPKFGRLGSPDEIRRTLYRCPKFGRRFCGGEFRRRKRGSRRVRISDAQGSAQAGGGKLGAVGADDSLVEPAQFLFLRDDVKFAYTAAFGHGSTAATYTRLQIFLPDA